ncbi:DUF3192 domain-containing protein [Neptunicella sp. SCSIO 80796]|uniref:DUF3192 domain-containing protein n=1 Tax=Neptunicella plasticusilytica TaxID=3117012 RepID=UPI003A4D3C20
MKKSLLVAALALPLTLTGCVVSVDGRDGDDWHSDWQDIEHQNRDKLTRLESGMTVNAVRKIMGVADFNELYQQQGNDIQVLFYRTQRKESDGVTSKDECTPIVFKNGTLIGLGETAYASI